jgi:hypothetical protein
MKRQRPRPRLRGTDRWLWVCLARFWPNWRKSSLVVRPETVVSWHRRGFRLFGARISRRKRSGRPGISRELRDLVCKMAEANPLWGAPRIHGELLKFGIEVSERTVSRLMPKRRKPPSQSWRAFLANHVNELISIRVGIIGCHGEIRRRSDGLQWHGRRGRRGGPLETRSPTYRGNHCVSPSRGFPINSLIRFEFVRGSHRLHNGAEYFNSFPGIAKLERDSNRLVPVTSRQYYLKQLPERAGVTSFGNLTRARGSLHLASPGA